MTILMVLLLIAVVIIFISAVNINSLSMKYSQKKQQLKTVQKSFEQLSNKVEYFQRRDDEILKRFTDFNIEYFETGNRFDTSVDHDAQVYSVIYSKCKICDKPIDVVDYPNKEVTAVISKLLYDMGYKVATDVCQECLNKADDLSLSTLGDKKIS